MAFLKKISLLISFTLLAAIGIAQNITKPTAFIPNYTKHFTPHHLLVDYFEHVSKNSEQVILNEYGRTNQQRPLIYAIVSSEKNIKNIEQIRTQHIDRTGLENGIKNSDQSLAIVWLSYGVHGNEAGASESSIATIYDLVNSDNKEIQSWLENTVVIMDPCINPDGYSRYTHWNWNAGNKIPNPNALSYEHNEPWPGGRVNHYLFDLNRDWAWQTQVETRQRLDIYNEWMPHIHVDFHEQGHNAPYYFAPAAQPFHEHITDFQSDFQTEIGINHTKYFDENGWLYFTREIFDLFYPSYGDTYPTFNGSIGMTYEQGGHSRAGRAILMENGDTLKLIDRILHHKTTGLSTIETSSKNADRLNEQFEEYFSQAATNPVGKYKAFVIKNSNDKKKIKALCTFLDKHKIEYGRSTNKSINAFDYTTGKKGTVNISDDDLVISAYQPKSVLVQVLFEPESFLVDSLTYDITAWAMPYAYGLDAYAVPTKIDVSKKYEFEDYRLDIGSSKKPYAYVTEWKSLADARFAGALMKKNIQVRFATEPFETEGKKYAAGTILITRADNKTVDDLDKTIQSLAIDYQQTIYGIKSGYVTSGSDFGSDKMQLMKKPKIALISGEGTSPNSFGHIWYYLEQDLDYQLAVVPLDALSRTSLDGFNILIMPDGGYAGLNKNVLDKVKKWVSGGGRLIAIGSALSKLTDKEGFTLKKYATEEEKSAAKKAREKEALEKRFRHYENQEREAIVNYMPGAIYKLKIDNSHPLAFGLPDYYFSLKTSSRSFDILKNTWNVGYIDDNPRSIGFAGSKAKENAKNTAVFAVQKMGSGSVVYMVDNPLFRGFWYQGKFLFSNALFFQ